MTAGTKAISVKTINSAIKNGITAIAVFSTLFGAYTLGGVGAILALPVAATIQGVIGTIVKNRKLI